MKKLIYPFLAVLVAVAMTACGQNNDGEGQINIGMTVQDLSNPTSSGYCQAIQNRAEAGGAKMNYVLCESNVSKQIMQIENFVSRGMDVIIVHPADPAGIESACREARVAGVKVISWDDKSRTRAPISSI